MKRLYDRQKNRKQIASPHLEKRSRAHIQREDNPESEGDQEGHEEESDNASRHKSSKRKGTELQGEFKKIKSPVFYGEHEEVAEAWLINMNKDF